MSLPNERPRPLRLLLILILFCTGSTVFSQQAATTNLSGTIKDPKWRARCRRKSVGKIQRHFSHQRATSNDNGVFVITNHGGR